MPSIHARMSIYYPLLNSTRESRQDIVQLLKTGLEKLATQAPFLAATAALDALTKRGTLATTGHDDGIAFLATGVDTIRTDLPSYEELERERFAPWKLPKGKTYPESLINPISTTQGHDAGLPACIFQINFIQGGLILTAALHHFVADGPSIDLIFRAWVAQCQGHSFSLETDRTILSSPRTPHSSEGLKLEQAMNARGCKVDSTQPDPNNPWSNLLAAPIKSAVLRFSRNALTTLKSEILAQRPSTPVSTSDCLYAIIWAGLVRAKATLAENKDEKESWTVFPVSFRSRRIPEFPSNFIGNATFLNGAVLPIDKLKNSEALPDAAVALRKVIENVDSAYLADGISWVNSIDEPSMRTWMSNPPRKMDAAFTSWSGLTPYNNWDFGFGRPTALRPPASPIPFVYLLPSKTDTTGEESFDVVIAATEQVHKLLMSDTEFRRYATDYHPEE